MSRLSSRSFRIFVGAINSYPHSLKSTCNFSALVIDEVILFLDYIPRYYISKYPRSECTSFQAKSLSEIKDKKIVGKAGERKERNEEWSDKERKHDLESNLKGNKSVANSAGKKNR